MKGTSITQKIYGQKLAPFQFMGEKEWSRLDQLNQYDPDTTDHSVNTGLLLVASASKQHVFNGVTFRFVDLLTRSRILGDELSVTLKQLGRSGVLHDIGKIKIDKKLMLSTGGYSLEESQIVSKHELYSEMKLAEDGFVVEAKIVGQHHNHHHETPASQFWFPPLNKWLPISGLLQWADSYDALRRERPYKLSLTSLGALAVICDNAQCDLVNPEITYFMTLGILASVKTHDKQLLKSSSLRELNNLQIIRTFLSKQLEKMMFTEPKVRPSTFIHFQELSRPELVQHVF